MNYLTKIARCNDLNKLATYVRAFGCLTIATISHTMTEREALNLLRKYERDASYVYDCNTVKEAKSYLRAKGYGC